MRYNFYLILSVSLFIAILYQSYFSAAQDQNTSLRISALTKKKNTKNHVEISKELEISDPFPDSSIKQTVISSSIPYKEIDIVRLKLDKNGAITTEVVGKKRVSVLYSGFNYPAKDYDQGIPKEMLLKLEKGLRGITASADDL